MIPYIYHAKVIAAAVKHKKNVVTTSYVSPAMMEYDQAWVYLYVWTRYVLHWENAVFFLINAAFFVKWICSAKDAGITVMNEIGLDPGIDHLYAVRTIDEVHKEGGKVIKK